MKKTYKYYTDKYGLVAAYRMITSDTNSIIENLETKLARNLSVGDITEEM
jgi:hypothetical protein